MENSGGNTDFQYYRDWLKLADEKVQDVEFDISIEFDAEEFLQMEADLNEIVEKPGSTPSESDRKSVRDRIVKNIKNSIEKIESTELQEYFNASLDLGPQCIYDPSRLPEEKRVDWILE